MAADDIQVFRNAAGTAMLTFDASGNLTVAGIKADVIAESTSGAGVTIDGALVKDGHIVDSVGFYDAAAPTKRVRIDAGTVTAGQTRVLTMPDQDVTIGAAGASILDDASVGAIRTTLGVGTGDSPTMTGLTLTGNLNVAGIAKFTGSTVLADAEHIDLRANYLQQNLDYTTAAGVTGGLVVNYLPTATVDTTSGAGVFTAGVDGASDPTVTTAGTATFAATDLVMISGSANNDGIYEVTGHVGTTLTLKSTSSGVSNRVEDFTLDQVTAGTDTGAAITKITVTVLRAGTDGVWEVGSGSQTGIAYSNLVRVSDIGSSVQAYSATLAALATQGLTRTAVAVVACADAPAAATTALLSVQLNNISGAVLGAARQVLLQINSAQYMDGSGPTDASLTLGTVTAGSIIATITVGSLYLIETDATGLFACTATNTDDTTSYFSVKTAEAGVSDSTKVCLVLGSNSDSATWSA